MTSKNNGQKKRMNRLMKGVLMTTFVSAAALMGTGCAQLGTAGRTMGDNAIGGVMNSVNDSINRTIGEARGGVWVPNKGSNTTRYGSNGQIFRASASGSGGGKVLFGADAERYLNKMMRDDIRQAQEIFKLRAQGAYSVTLAYAGSDRYERAAAKSAASSVKRISDAYGRSIRGYTSHEQLDAAYTNFIDAMNKYEEGLEAGGGSNIPQLVSQFSRDLTSTGTRTAQNAPTR